MGEPGGRNLASEGSTGVCRVPWRLLAVALLLVGECSGGLGPAAEAAAHGDFAAPAQHGALPPQVQAMVAQLVETVEALRAEVLELKDRGRSQERAAARSAVLARAKSKNQQQVVVQQQQQ